MVEAEVVKVEVGVVDVVEFMGGLEKFLGGVGVVW